MNCDFLAFDFSVVKKIKKGVSMGLNLNLNPVSQTVAQYFVSAMAGQVQIDSIGLASTLGLKAQTVNITGFTDFLAETGSLATLFLDQSPTGGVINLSAAGVAPGISLDSSPMEGDIVSSMAVNSAGIAMCYGIPGLGGSIGMGESSMILSMGPPDVGATIILTPTSITFQVGETIMTLTAAGIVTTAPVVEINCDDTNLILSAEGITEEVGEVTREVTAEGHNFTAGEVELNVGVEGMMAEAPTNTAEFEGTSEMNSALITEAADAMLSVEASISMVE